VNPRDATGGSFRSLYLGLLAVFASVGVFLLMLTGPYSDLWLMASGSTDPRAKYLDVIAMSLMYSAPVLATLLPGSKRLSRIPFLLRMMLYGLATLWLFAGASGWIAFFGDMVESDNPAAGLLLLLVVPPIAVGMFAVFLMFLMRLAFQRRARRTEQAFRAERQELE